MSLDNNSANNFKDFLDAIKPYLNYQPVDLSCMGMDAFQFSTDEKPVGMWTDRKILYAKTVDCGALPNASEKTVNHGILNIDKITLILGTGLFSNGTSMFLPLVYNANDVTFTTKIAVNKTQIVMSNDADRSNVNGFVTLFYTKTTDSPLASDEKFAGLTASGEVIYERTIDYGSTVAIPNSGFTSIGIDASNISMILYAYGYHTDDARCCPLIAIKENNLIKCIVARAGSGMELRYFTIRYTKTS